MLASSRKLLLNLIICFSFAFVESNNSSDEREGKGMEDAFSCHDQGGWKSNTDVVDEDDILKETMID